MSRAGRAAKRTGQALAVGAAAFVGFVAAGFVFARPRDLRERAPLAAARSVFGGGLGRTADGPEDIPPAGWWEILKRTAILTARNRLMAEAAAVTFFSLLALFPALTAIVSLYGLFADPDAISRLLDAVSDVMPSAALEVLRGQLNHLIETGQRGLSYGVGIGFVAALWSANQGSKALFESLNAIYREKEKRSYARFVLEAYVFTIGGIIFTIAAMIVVVVWPKVMASLGLGDGAETFLRWVRWPVILFVVTFFLANAYRFGPSRENPQWRWVTWGGSLAAVSWIVVSLAFSWYVQTFGSFERMYGSLGAIVAFMFWIWLSTLVALIGAQLNSEMEHQTAVDTTTGSPLPLGLRGATQADTVA